MTSFASIDIVQTLAAIRQRRKELKLRQRHLAFGLKISVAAYHKIERGLTALTLERFNEIAEILQSGPDLLIRIEICGHKTAESQSLSLLL